MAEWLLPWEQWAVLLVLAGVFISFLRGWGSPDIVALSALAVLLLSGLLTSEQALQSFSNPAPIIIASMFVLSAALDRTGVIEVMAGAFRKMAGETELRAAVVLMITAAVLSAFVNNTPVVVVFMPIVLALARDTGMKASKLLIPLSFASIVGGTCTVIGTSTNILVKEIYETTEAGMADPIGIFEITKLGVVYVTIGILYLTFWGRKLLPQRETLANLISGLKNREFLTEAFVSKESPLIGKKIEDTPLRRMREVRVVEVTRDGRRIMDPLDKIEFRAGDRLQMKTHVAGVQGIQATTGLELGRELGLERMETQRPVLMEAIVGPRSRMIGKSLTQLNIRQRFGVLILAIHRQGVNLQDRFEDTVLEFGDSLLIEGPAHRIRQLVDAGDFLSLNEPQQRPLRRSKAPFALAALAAFVLLGAFSPLPLEGVALGGALFVVATRCVDLTDAYDAVEWKVIFLIIGMLAVGQAMDSSGTAQTLANGVLTVFGPFGPWVMLSMVYLMASLFTELISNNAVAALLTPLVLVIAAGLDVDARPFVIAVMFASSASFMTPIGYQTNTYIFGAGGYKFSDFPKVGWPLALMLWLVASCLIPLLWPF
jgi:di/tricarboxylate transporter